MAACSWLMNDDAMRALVDVGFAGPFTFEAPATVQRKLTAFDKLNNCPHGSLAVARAYEKALYETGKYMLQTYGCYEE